MKCFQGSYSDRSNNYNVLSSPPNMAQLSLPLTPPATPSTPQQKWMTPSRTGSGLSLNAREFVPSISICKAEADNAGGNLRAGFNGTSPLQFPLSPDSVPQHLLNSYTGSLFMLRHQQILQERQLLQKLELASTAQAKQQFAVPNQTHDEISNSLRMFAVLSTCTTNDAPSTPVDEVMQEFAANGYTSDDYNRYQQNLASSDFQKNFNGNSFPSAFNAYNYEFNASIQKGLHQNLFYNQQQLLHDKLVAYELWRQNMLKVLKTPQLRRGDFSNLPVTGDANSKMGVDYDNQNIKPTRYYKKEKQVMPKRCVFCENNNEPDAVVKSHAVRDSQGRVLCPKLRVYICPICKASGDSAHTVKYCPKKPIVTMEETMNGSQNGGFRTVRNTSSYKLAQKPILADIIRAETLRSVKGTNTYKPPQMKL